MRSIQIFCFATVVLPLVCQGQQSAVPDGRQLALGDHCYTITTNSPDGPKPRGVTFQSVTRIKVQGVDALAVVVHQHLLNGKFDIRDSFLLRREDLRPIRLDTERDGKPHVHLDYTPKRITGWKMAGETKQAVNLPLNGPVWDGNLWGETFAALPLAIGNSFTLPTYQYDSGFGSFAVDVIDQHEEETPSGTMQAWRIKAGPSLSRQVEYIVSTHPGLEISYAAGPSNQRIGGECVGLH